MRAHRPDLLLVDPTIPDCDGPSLVKQIKAEFPTVPVIIVTTVGNEKLAIRALQSGAASYVPNHLLEEELLPTVHEVLNVSNNQRCRLRMLEQMRDFQCSFVLENDRSLIPPLVGYLQEHFSAAGNLRGRGGHASRHCLGRSARQRAVPWQPRSRLGVARVGQ